jgi:hypothetical protein
MSAKHRSGGCQCGAVRFRVTGALGDASVCHCRMCQKAMGAFYAPLVSIRDGSLEWTRSKPAWFQSSNHARRGFCAKCGTPLAYDAPDGLALTIASFDNPTDIVPLVQWGSEGKLPYADRIHSLPSRKTEEDMEDAPFLAELVSHQHPDHDTETWPPRRKS